MGDPEAAAPAPGNTTTAQVTVPWGARLAGVSLLLFGVLNVVFGVLSLTSTAVNLGVGAAGGFVVAGAVTTAAGWLVWRGNQPATLVALSLLALLLVAQIGDVVADGGPGVAPGGLAGRFAGVVLLTAVLSLAALQLRRRAPGRRRS